MELKVSSPQSAVGSPQSAVGNPQLLNLELKTEDWRLET
jgi:hypothetical protein